MRIFRFAIAMLVKESKQSLFYLLTLVFSISAIFIFMNVYMNPALGRTGTMTGTLIVLLIMVTVMNAFVANRYFLNGKRSFLASCTICGGTIFTLSKILITQNLILMLLAIPLGAGLGYISTPLITRMIITDTAVSTFGYFHAEGLYFLISVVILEVLYFTMLDASYVYQTSLMDLLAEQESTRIDKVEKTRKWNGFVLYALPAAAVIYLLIPLSGAAFVFLSALLLLLCFILLNYSIPHEISQRKRKHQTLRKDSMILLGDGKASLSSISLFVLAFYANLLIGCSCVIEMAAQQSASRLLCAAYTVLLLIMGVNIFYKLVNDTMSRKHEFLTLYKIGYAKQQLAALLKKEFMMYLLLFLVPLPFALIIVARSVAASLVPFTLGCYLLGMYVLISAVSILISYFVYRHFVFLDIKERVNGWNQ